MDDEDRRVPAGGASAHMNSEGTPFGRYRLLSMLGRGGMGEVWRAFDTDTQRVVALKVLAPHLADDPQFTQRFRREAFAAAGLANPHVVPIHHYGEIDTRLYVDTRLVEGRDLHQIIVQGPLSLYRATSIVEQIAPALHAAHRIGLVHRDVKPSNILIDDEDFAYLIDFGIARAIGQTSMTGTSGVIGTWAYMAPERLSKDQNDSRADVYALACVLHECLTGKQPFPAGSLERQIAAHLSDPPPQPSKMQPSVPTSMDAVVARGMAKDPDERFQTAKELAVAARAAASTYPHSAPTQAAEPRITPRSQPRQPSSLKRSPVAASNKSKAATAKGDTPQLKQRVPSEPKQAAAKRPNATAAAKPPAKSSKPKPAATPPAAKRPARATAAKPPAAAPTSQRRLANATPKHEQSGFNVVIFVFFLVLVVIAFVAGLALMRSTHQSGTSNQGRAFSAHSLPPHGRLPAGGMGDSSMTGSAGSGQRERQLEAPHQHTVTAVGGRKLDATGAVSTRGSG